MASKIKARKSSKSLVARISEKKGWDRITIISQVVKIMDFKIT